MYARGRLQIDWPGNQKHFGASLRCGSRPSWQRSLARRWAPAGAGALAAAVFAVLFIVVPRSESPAVNPLASAAPEDLEMLADSDGVQLGREQDVDYDFYEWAVSEAKGAGAPSVGT